MWADGQRDGRPAEYRRRPLRKIRNSISCTTPQSLTDAVAKAVTGQLANKPTCGQSTRGQDNSWTGQVAHKSTHGQVILLVSRNIILVVIDEFLTVYY